MHEEVDALSVPSPVKEAVIREYFRALGAKGAKSTIANLTPEQLKEKMRMMQEARWKNKRQ